MILVVIVGVGIMGPAPSAAASTPVAPMNIGSSPVSPSDVNSPTIFGTAEPGSLVRLYTSAACTGAPVAEGVVSADGTFSLVVTVPDNSVTNFHATATDAAGNVSPCSAGFTYVEDSTLPDTDTTPPVVTGVPDREPNANGWYRAPVTIDWQATDDSGSATDPPDTIAATEGAGVVYTSDPSCDPSGNCATGSLALSIDMTGPTVTCESPEPVFLLGEAGAVSAAVADELSGPVTTMLWATADTSTVGTKTVELTGEDRAGNTRTASCGYRVAFGFEGFFAPVDNPDVLNVVRAGQTVPLKWRLTDASGAPVTDLAAATISVQGLSCSSGTSEDQIEETTAGGSGLQHLGDGYYQLNWKTSRSYAGSCKTLRLDLGEGAYRTALFRFTG